MREGRANVVRLVRLGILPVDPTAPVRINMSLAILKLGLDEVRRAGPTMLLRFKESEGKTDALAVAGEQRCGETLGIGRYGT